MSITEAAHFLKRLDKKVAIDRAEIQFFKELLSYIESLPHEFRMQPKVTNSLYLLRDRIKKEEDEIREMEDVRRLLEKVESGNLSDPALPTVKYQDVLRGLNMPGERRRFAPGDYYLDERLKELRNVAVPSVTIGLNDFEVEYFKGRAKQREPYRYSGSFTVPGG